MFSKYKEQMDKDSPAGTKYFSHYHSNFLRSYGMVSPAPDHETIINRLHPVSSEWLKRPGVALSEFAKTLVKNMQWLATGGEMLMNDMAIEDVNANLQPLLKSLSNLNTKNEHARPKAKHVKNVLTTLYKNVPHITKAMNDMVQLGGSMFITGIQYLVVKELLSHPQIYANKMVGTNPNITTFKPDTSVAGLLSMLYHFSCRSVKSSESVPTTSSRNLLDELSAAEKSGKRKSTTVLLKSDDSSSSSSSSSFSADKNRRKKNKDKKKRSHKKILKTSKPRKPNAQERANWLSFLQTNCTSLARVSKITE